MQEENRTKWERVECSQVIVDPGCFSNLPSCCEETNMKQQLKNVGLA